MINIINIMDIDYKAKYFKYKSKYLNIIQKQYGGKFIDPKCNNYDVYLQNYNHCKNQPHGNNNTKIIFIGILSYNNTSIRGICQIYNKLIFDFGFKKENIFCMFAINELVDCHTNNKAEFKTVNLIHHAKLLNNQGKCAFNKSKWIIGRDDDATNLLNINLPDRANKLVSSLYNCNPIFLQAIMETPLHFSLNYIQNGSNQQYNLLVENFYKQIKPYFNRQDRVIMDINTHGSSNDIEYFNGTNINIQQCYNILIKPVLDWLTYGTLLLSSYFCDNVLFNINLDAHMKISATNKYILFSHQPKNKIADIFVDRVKMSNDYDMNYSLMIKDGNETNNIYDIEPLIDTNILDHLNNFIKRYDPSYIFDDCKISTDDVYIEANGLYKIAFIYNKFKEVCYALYINGKINYNFSHVIDFMNDVLVNIDYTNNKKISYAQECIDELFTNTCIGYSTNDIVLNILLDNSKKSTKVIDIKRDIYKFYITSKFSIFGKCFLTNNYIDTLIKNYNPDGILLSNIQNFDDYIINFIN